MQRGLAGLREEERFGPWVYQVARSAILDHRRRAARRPVDTDEAPEEAVPAVDVEEDGAVEREFANYVAPFIAMLPSPYREALTLTEPEGLTQKDAAVMLGISLSGMKSRVQRGRVKLRELFQECCEMRRWANFWWRWGFLGRRRGHRGVISSPALIRAFISS